MATFNEFKDGLRAIVQHGSSDVKRKIVNRLYSGNNRYPIELTLFMTLYTTKVASVYQPQEGVTRVSGEFFAQLFESAITDSHEWASLFAQLLQRYAGIDLRPGSVLFAQDWLSFCPDVDPRPDQIRAIRDISLLVAGLAYTIALN